MLKILHKGRFVTMTDEPLFVRKNSNGVWVQTAEENAECISVHGDLYPMDEVNIVEFTAADYMNEQANIVERTNANVAYIAMMTDVDIPGV